MNEDTTYIDILIMSLRKKIEILETIDRDNLVQETLLKKSDVTIEEIQATEDKKKSALEQLEQADQGFERVYQRVKESLEENRYRYEEEIKTLQALIKKITDYTTKIQAQEIRNKQLMEFFFNRKKQEIKAFKFNHNTASQYTRHLANRDSGQSYFFDNKK